MNTRPIALAVSAIVSSAFFLAMPVSAGIPVTCDYTASNHKVRISGFSSAKIQRGIDDRIKVNGVWCDGQATVFNTDSIVVLAGAATQFVSLYLDNGGFKPGFTNEAGSSDEIEISVSLGGDPDSISVYGSGLVDQIVVGRSSGFGVKGRMNLNATETTSVDADLTLIVGVEEVIVWGRNGNDVISGTGGAGTGDPANFVLKLAGGDNGDTITGGEITDSIIGGNGPDVLKGGAGADFIDSIDGVQGNDEIFGGNGSDSCQADAGDSVTNCP